MNDETRPRGPGSGSAAHHSNADACIVATLADADLIERSDERDQWLRRMAREYCAAYDLGYQHGIEAGRRQVLAEEAQWRRDTAALVTGAPKYSRYASAAEIDRRRYPPGGRLSWLQAGEDGDG